jgi:hypothetical protein
MKNILKSQTQKSCVAVAFFSVLIIVLLMSRSPQGLYSDPAWGTKAMQQYFCKESSTINHLSQPSVHNLTETTEAWIAWWPPSTQILTYPLIANGVGLGTAIRILVVLCLFFGIIGWMRWFSMFMLPRWMLIMLALLFPWMRYSTHNLHFYSAEMLMYAWTPWILLGAHTMGKVFSERRHGFITASVLFGLTGLGFSVSYLFKYSGVFVAVGAFIYLSATTFREKNYTLIKRSTYLLILAICFIIPIAAWNIINYKLSGCMNPVTARFHINFDWHHLLYAISDPSLGMADLDSLLNYLLYHPERTIGNPFLSGYIGFPGGLLLLFLMLRAKGKTRHEILAKYSFFTSSAIMLVLWNTYFPGQGDYAARYLAGGSIAILPLALQEGFVTWKKTKNAIARGILFSALLLYVILPFVYGSISVIVKSFRIAPGYRLGVEQIYNPLLSDSDIKGVQDKLMRIFSPKTDIWYLTDPVTALNLNGRAIITHADFETIEELRERKYTAKSTLRVFALLPPHFEENGKGDAIRKSFNNAETWTKLNIDKCKFNVWMTTLEKPH